MPITKRALTDELRDWFDRLDQDVWDKAREDFRKQHGRYPSGRESAGFVVATCGSERIKAIWHRLHTAVSFDDLRRPLPDGAPARESRRPRRVKTG